MAASTASDEELEFTAFVEDVEPRLRRALVSRYGLDDGREATARALAWSWEHWSEVKDMTNPSGYLYRVACSGQRRRRQRHLFARADASAPEIEPGLRPALDALSEQQRVAVVLTLGFEWTLAEVAELTGSSISTVNTHRRRGLERLRRKLGVELAPTPAAERWEP
jgi:DNA-directed RNA polymerase specialized sigma24 family protein